MRVLRTVACLCLLAAPLAAQRSSTYADVDPFIGTGAEGHTFPGASLPFGMVQLSPDTQIRPVKQSYKWAAGYRYSDTTILGFSHTHFSGAGHSDLGDVLVQPISGDVRLDPGDIDKPESGYRSRFQHKTEEAHPGYYAVTLDDYNVRAELTATTRVGVHRYTFPAGKPAHLLIDLRSSIYNYPGKVLWSSLRIRHEGDGSTTLTGMRETRGWAPARQLFFAMRFSAPVTGTHLYNREDQPILYRGFKTPGDTPEDTQAIEGRGIVAAVDFASAQKLIVKVAISPVSEANALANMQAEVPAFDFDAVRTQAQQRWQDVLSILRVDADEPTRKTLATALYHSLLAPSIAMDANGDYRGPDHAVHHADGFNFVSSLSLWDTYRAEQPLMTLIEPPRVTSDLVRSMLASQQQSPFGILPVWQFAGIETWCMIGYHAVPILADAIMKGMDKPGPDTPGFDANAALDAMVASADYRPYGHIGEYIDKGYIPIDTGAPGSHDESVSQTIEYAFDDWTIAQVARKLGRNDIADRFTKRAGYWRNVFNTKDGFAEPRLADGSYRKPFDPAKAGAGSGFTEGNAWQYSWYQPQDEQGLIQLLGGDIALVDKLDKMFDQHVDPKQYADVEDISGLIGQYIHGNEPSHHLAYLYSYAGQPWRTDERLQQIISSQYQPTPDGLVGNDDLGQMSAWLLFSEMGFYPVAPGSNQYVIGRPFARDIDLQLGNGKHLHIVASQLIDENKYVQSVMLNGKPIDRVYLTHDELMAGGTLRFEMGQEPNRKWAVSPAARPYSMSSPGSSDQQPRRVKAPRSRHLWR
ncbi:GH92 family glycosyl hydrolase [Terriglobus aquaticus]|uniref:GH92 family glycosyl hydrolase n=1 Tax=Terriglobus aquaticus TaxID=940139 RepID=A0ABW9KRW5_9BACT|nr:GH92 family glycosyl hydrolase [Terriglobus aquaticus]